MTAAIIVSPLPPVSDQVVDREAGRDGQAGEIRLLVLRGDDRRLERQAQLLGERLHEAGDRDRGAGEDAVLEEGVHQLADTVRNSLNFYRMQESAERVEQGMVTGGAVAIPGFVEALSEQLRLPLESAVVASQDEDADLGRLTVAAGLAVENVVD